VKRLRIAGLRSDGLGPIDLELDAGECVCLSGPSGAGKTTYARRLEAEGMVRLSFDAGIWARGITGGEVPEEVREEIRTELRTELLVVPPESWRASLCGFPVGGRCVLVVDRAHHARRAVPAFVVVEPVAPVQHDRLGLAGVGELVA